MEKGGGHTGILQVGSWGTEACGGRLYPGTEGHERSVAITSGPAPGLPVRAGAPCWAVVVPREGLQPEPPTDLVETLRGVQARALRARH